ncbi:ly6/PLAUR domain-containing protein 1 [Clarias gariepinus]
MLACARWRMPVLALRVLTVLLCLREVGPLQIQCYQCEEIRQDDCSSPEFIVNCTVNVQDMCQKEVLIMEDGVHYRKSCASSGACLIASSGYQQFCTGKINSVCITCCNTPLCNGPRHRRRPLGSPAPPLPLLPFSLLLSSALLSLSLSLCLPLHPSVSPTEVTAPCSVSFT